MADGLHWHACLSRATLCGWTRRRKPCQIPLRHWAKEEKSQSGGVGIVPRVESNAMSRILRSVMTEHHASVKWTRTSPHFTYGSYNRSHDVIFKGGAIVLPASSAAAFKGDPDRVDPEEAFVASLSSCHMLTFLAICARKRLTVDWYADDATGLLEKDKGGKLWMAQVMLRPRTVFAPGSQPDPAVLRDIHRQAHEQCFIANSVRTDVTVEPRD